jgi:hypothetical protein
MALASHAEYHVSKLQKVDRLLGLQRMLKKEVADLSKGFELADAITKSVSMIASDDAEAEEPLDCHQNLAIPLMLDHHELRQNLKADGHFRMTIDAYVEATFAIHKTDDPVR